MKKKSGRSSGGSSKKMHVHRFHLISLGCNVSLNETLKLITTRVIESNWNRKRKAFKAHTAVIHRACYQETAYTLDWPHSLYRVLHIYAEAVVFEYRFYSYRRNCSDVFTATVGMRMITIASEPICHTSDKFVKYTISPIRVLRHSMFENRGNLSENLQRWDEWKRVSVSLRGKLLKLFNSMGNSIKRGK